jgi:hypothetical protein
MMLDAVSDIYATFTGFESNVTLYDLNVEQGGQSLASVAQLSLDGGYGEGEDGLETSYAIAVSGLETAMIPAPENLTPHEARIEIGLFNMPENLFQRFIEMGMASENLSEAEQEAFWNQQLLELVMTTGMGIFVEDTYIGADTARLDLSLSAQAAPQSPLGGVGEFSLTIENMQTIVDTLGLANDQQVAPVLAMLTAFSNRTTEDGNTIDSFELQVTDEGKLMLNNKDVTAMFMPGAPVPPAAEEEAEKATTE